MGLEHFCEFLETYHGRDKVMRLLCYTCKLLSGLYSRKCDKLNNIYNILNECRTVLRLFDDLPMLNYTLSYGLGSNEPDIYMQVCGVIINVLDQLYYPLEHIAWAADKGFLSLHSERWWTYSTICWVLSIYFSLAKSLRYFTVIKQHRTHLESGPDLGKSLRLTSRLQLNELLTALRCASDLLHAIHWLPADILWAGKLSDWQIGALGTFSSILSLIQSFYIVSVSENINKDDDQNDNDEGQTEYQKLLSQFLEAMKRDDQSKNVYPYSELYDIWLL